MSQPQLPSPTVTSSVNLDEMIAVTDRLNSILIKESMLLAAMQMRDLEPLQEEKFALSARLASFQRALAADEAIAGNSHPATRDRLLTMAGELAGNIEENMRLTSIAQSVNRRVMQTFIEVLAEQQRVSVYSDQGVHGSAPDVTISININERA